MAVLRAACVYLNEADNYLDFAFDEKAGALGGVEAALGAIPGVAYVPAAARQGGGSGIMVAILKGYKTDEVLAAVKKVLNPKLPIGVYSLELRVNRCRRDLHNSGECFPAFIPGFEPKSKNSFLNQLHVGVTRINMKELIPASGPTSPALYVNAMVALFKRMGASVQQADLSVEFCC